MSEKRRDNKGRILRVGESQRKDGKYEFKYTDIRGVRRSEYSWKLVDTDKVPKGKRDCESLRSIEKRLLKDLDYEIHSYEADRMTLNHFYDDYMDAKVDLQSSTRVNYMYMYDKYIRDELGYHSISTIKYSHIKKLYLSLIHEKGFKPNSMEIVNSILHPVFEIAVRDDYIRKNPTEGVMREIKLTHDWEKPKRHALTVEQQSRFIDFIVNSPIYGKWCPMFTFFLGTGCRVGEATGLRWDDVDFKNSIIDINHALIYRKCEDGKCRFHITTPKTKNSNRIIPMFQEVRAALLQLKERQLKRGLNNATVDGYKNFVFLNRYGDVFSAHAINRVINRICKAYNEEESENAAKENRSPILLPHFSVHNLRHTFCTRFCEQERNIKIIQEIMGHADITTTMDIYNEATKEAKIDSFKRLEGKIKIC